MDFETLHQFELTLMTHLQTIRGPLLDLVMVFLNLLDTQPFYIVVVACVWFGFRHKWGIALLFLSLISSLINQDLKTLLAQPRPEHLDPALGLVWATSYGFPSGAAQGFVTIFGFLALQVKKKWFWVASIFLILLVSFSRVYLGLHFPTDILGGWAIGLLLLWGYWKGLPLAERFLRRQTRWRLMCISALCTFILCLLCLRPSLMLLMIFGFGVSVGLIWAPRFQEPQRVSQRITRPLIALAGIFLMQKGAETWVAFMPQAIQFSWLTFAHFIIGAWLSFGMGILCRQRSLK
jgi:membrane-associated phospholipid phosphatase